LFAVSNQVDIVSTRSLIFVPPNNHVAELFVQLDHEAGAVCLLAGDQGAAASAEWVQYDAVSLLVGLIVQLVYVSAGCQRQNRALAKGLQRVPSAQRYFIPDAG
jgi:hypothetical protein